LAFLFLTDIHHIAARIHLGSLGDSESGFGHTAKYMEYLTISTDLDKDRIRLSDDHSVTKRKYEVFKDYTGRIK
jgi:hypothetical protein